MSYQNITTEREERLFILTINRPDVMSALNPETHAEMAQAFDVFEQDPDLWVAIVTGSGETAFCAGGDISAMVDAK
jgi:enoyl-CoA hydratase/carnithine racemase